MTERLYYHDSFLYEFDARIVDINSAGPRPFVVLDRSAFYPTSGGQVFDTGWLGNDSAQKVRVDEVAEDEQGAVLHYLEAAGDLKPGAQIHGLIDADRRRDHMQQHSGQHVLSAAFIKLFNQPTVSFHMGADYCSIDLDTKALTSQQVEAAEALANDIVTENRPVQIRFVTQEEARTLGLRKLPLAEREKLRLIEIHDFDLSACGGTHVASTGQIGCILLRKTEKVRQGWRVEFVCGRRAIATARADYATLAESAALSSSQLRDLPQQIKKFQDDARVSRKAREQLLEELADLNAARLLAETTEHNGRRVVVRVFSDCDLTFIKLLAQRITRQNSAAIALLASTEQPASLVFGQSSGQLFDMGTLMKEALAQLGGRGGGSKDMAQGGPTSTDRLDAVLAQLAVKLGD